MAKLSCKYRVLRGLIKAIGWKKSFVRPAEKMLAQARKAQEKTRIPKLSHPAVQYEIKEFQGAKVVYITHQEPTAHACLFLIGGGMLRHPFPAAIKKALEIGVKTGRDMVVPYYPLCTDHVIDEIYDWVYALYQSMLKHYDASKIIVTGSSSGANLALGLAAHINALQEGVVMPGKIYASSPGESFQDEEMIRRGRELNDKDILLDVHYMEIVGHILTKGKVVPEYMLYLEKGDYRGLREVYLCYGTDEVLYAAYEPILNQLLACDVHVTTEIGEGLFHCYPFFPLVKESKAGWDRMMAYHEV